MSYIYSSILSILPSELNITGRLPSYKSVRKIWSQTWLPDTRVWLPETRVYVPRPSLARDLCKVWRAKMDNITLRL